LSDGPITDVNQLKVVDLATAAAIQSACGIPSRAAPTLRMETAAPAAITKPGSERWPVKTGQDADRKQVGKNVINGKDLGAGIVPATVEELISIPRPPGLIVLTADPPAFQRKRSQPVETTIWQVDGTITVLNQEADGDYHLVVQGASGATMIAEVPTPTKPFIGDSPWLANIAAARQAVNDKLVKTLSPHDFVLPAEGKKLVPKESFSAAPSDPHVAATLQTRGSFVTPSGAEEAAMLTFQTAVPATKVRITGVGFFDRAHGATGAAPNVIELHPVLKIVWL